MTWQPAGDFPTRYGWNTPVTAPGPEGFAMLKNIRSIQRDPLTYLNTVWHDHGDVLQFPIPRPATYLVSSAQGARDILVNHNKSMGKRTVQYSTLSLVTGQGLLTADTQAWRPRRRMLQPAFHHEMVALTRDRVTSALERLNSEWLDCTSTGPVLIDVDQAMMELALEITGATLFGVDLTADAAQITQATVTALHGVIARARNPLPIPLSIPTPNNIGMNRAIRRLESAVSAIVVARQRDLLQPGDAIRDMLDVLLDPDVETPLSPQQIRDEVATFIVAGHETVASGLTWAWHLLSRNQHEQELLARDSARAALVFDETLRLYPPAWVITRRVLEDVIIDDFLIPAQSMVIVSPWLVHRNTDIWQDPASFIPDRFSGSAPQLGYIPFGAGPRQCIGRDMARLEANMILQDLSSKWRFEPAITSEVAIDASVTLRPATGLPMRISRR